MVRATGCGALLLVLAGALASATPPAETEQKKPAVDLIAALSRTLDISKAANPMPLKDFLEMLRDTQGVTILTDPEAFKAEGVDDIEQAQVKVPLMTGRLRTILRLVTSQVNGTFLVRPDYIEITTAKRARAEWSNAEIWVRGELGDSEPNVPELQRPLAPFVHVRFQQRPLEEALQELADQAGVSILLDTKRAKDKSKDPVTAKLVNMPLDTAVRLLADMVELRALVVDNGIYVTTKENALALQAEQEKRRQAVMQQQFGVPPAAGGLGGLGGPLAK